MTFDLEQMLNDLLVFRLVPVYAESATTHFIFHLSYTVCDQIQPHPSAAIV